MAPMTPNDVQGMLDYQRMQLVSTFTQAAASMRAAAQEAEAAATLFGAIGANFSGDPVALAALNSRLHLTTSNALSGLTAAANGVNTTTTTDDSGLGKKRRRSAKDKPIKDPNAPKRPTGAYLLFQNDVRKQIQEMMPGSTQQVILAEVSQRWKDLDKDSKQAYFDAVEKAKKDYDVKKRDYDAHKDDNSVAKELLADHPTPTKSSEEVETSSEAEDEGERKGDDDEDTEDEQESEGESGSEEELPPPPPPKKQKKAPAPPAAPALTSKTAKPKRKQSAVADRPESSRKTTKPKTKA